VLGFTERNSTKAGTGAIILKTVTRQLTCEFAGKDEKKAMVHAMTMRAYGFVADLVLSITQ